MTRLALVPCLAILTACFEPHAATDRVVQQRDCYTCHRTEYEATGGPAFPDPVPRHTTTGCSTDCVQCHTTTTWVNSLGGCVHPESAFPLMSMGTKHTNIACSDCHSEAISLATGATAAHGANTDCIACHPNTSQQQSDHVGVTYSAGTLAGRPYAYSTSDHRFCLDCHTNGLALGHGANNPFRLPHHGSTCAQCHDSASGLGHAGGADVLCMNGSCHTGTGGSDRAHHADTNHHPGCLASGCHPDGRGG